MKKGSINPHLYKARIGNCILCGTEYRATKDFIGHIQKWCSKKCWNKRSSVINKCLFCNNEIKTYKSVNKKYCGNKCRNLHYRDRWKGENSHFWKGGKTKESKILRTTAKYREWRMLVFTRDGFKCIWCGKKDKTLEADHIKEQSRYPELRYDLDNGRTLCKECHKKTDNYGYKCNKTGNG